MESKDLLLRDLYEKKRLIEYQVKTVQAQLTSVEKRLQRLKESTLFYVFFFVIPIILFLLYLVVTFVMGDVGYMNMLLGSITMGIIAGISIIYLMLVPIFVYQLVKSIVMLQINNENQTVDWTPPAVKEEERYYRRPKAAEPEATYQTERQKLLWVLSRYYTVQPTLDELIVRVKTDAKSEEYDEIREQIKNIALYEDVLPAQAIPRDAKKKISFLSTVISIAVIALILLAMGIF